MPWVKRLKLHIYEHVMKPNLIHILLMGSLIIVSTQMLILIYYLFSDYLRVSSIVPLLTSENITSRKFFKDCI